MQNDGGITASGAFFDSVVAKSDFVNSGYILSVIFQIVATVRLILSGLVVGNQPTYGWWPNLVNTRRAGFEDGKPRILKESIENQQS